MKRLQSYESYGLITEGKEVDLEKEQQLQAKTREQMDIIKKNMVKLDSSNRKESDKLIEKSKMIGTMAKLYGTLAKSMAKESQLMMAVGQIKRKA